MGAPPIDPAAPAAFFEMAMGLPDVFRNFSEEIRSFHRSKGKIASDTPGKQADIATGNGNGIDHLPKLVPDPVVVNKDQRMMTPYVSVFDDSSEQNAALFSEEFKRCSGIIGFVEGIESEDTKPFTEFPQAAIGGESNVPIRFHKTNPTYPDR